MWGAPPWCFDMLPPASHPFPPPSSHPFPRNNTSLMSRREPFPEDKPLWKQPFFAKFSKKHLHLGWLFFFSPLELCLLFFKNYILLTFLLPASDDIFPGNFLPVIWIFSFLNLWDVFLLSLSLMTFSSDSWHIHFRKQHCKEIFGQWHFGKHLAVANREGHIHVDPGNRTPRKFPWMLMAWAYDGSWER